MRRPLAAVLLLWAPGCARRSARTGPRGPVRLVRASGACRTSVGLAGTCAGVSGGASGGGRGRQLPRRPAVGGPGRRPGTTAVYVLLERGGRVAQAARPGCRARCAYGVALTWNDRVADASAAATRTAPRGAPSRFDGTGARCARRAPASPAAGSTRLRRRRRSSTTIVARRRRARGPGPDLADPRPLVPRPVGRGTSGGWAERPPWPGPARHKAVAAVRAAGARRRFFISSAESVDLAEARRRAGASAPVPLGRLPLHPRPGMADPRGPASPHGRRSGPAAAMGSGQPGGPRGRRRLVRWMPRRPASRVPP